jgi:hypothetical protein
MWGYELNSSPFLPCLSQPDAVLLFKDWDCYVRNTKERKLVCRCFDFRKKKKMFVKNISEAKAANSVFAFQNQGVQVVLT